MADRQIDPSRLHGDALRRWYLRSPADIEQERQADEAQRYNSFFERERGADLKPGFSREPEASPRNVDPGFGREPETPPQNIDPGFSWIQAGPNRWRSATASSHSPNSAADVQGEQQNDGAFLDKGLAGPEDGGQLIDVGNPANRRLKREYERAYGAWPKTEDGRNFHVAHKKAIADGGTRFC
jgi:hypothetical protein